MGFISDALQSGSVLLREGLEAILVIAALAAFLRKAGAGRAIAWLYAGALAGIVASLFAAAAFEAFFDGMHDDRIEAAVLIFAAAMMLYMSGWLYLRQDPAAWTSDLRHAATTIGPRATLSMATIAFLAVLREGAETALFLHAMARTSNGWTLGILTGMGVASLALVLLVIAIVWLAVRLPLRPMFLVTSAFLFVMGLKFVGAAIQECQEQVLLPVHPADVPRWLIDLGLNPSWEALSTQALIGTAALLGLLAAQRTRAA
ncbi:MAG: FTR1 family protein [Hyphomicrobiaceae bacterium]|nr:FTR1 family protein [Hyphomicrobiaceae bacterium]